ncbi:KpsF/GutQ family sugar-phosphate isomerase, partial [bacterium]|nr:KpsF/GutQ family sugar-phosphate isomerase [bacterium]
MTAVLENNLSVQENLDKDCAIRTINMEIDTITKLRDSLDASLTKALDIMQKARGRIIITG